MTDQRLKEHQQGVFKKLHYLNVSKRFPYKSDSVEAIFSSHMIEHLQPAVAEHMLSECYRVLAPERVCRIVAPSLRWAFSPYEEDKPEAMLEAVFQHDQKNPKNRHHGMYTGQSLARLMSEVGFQDVREYSYQEGRLPDLEILDNRPENSIYVEGIKTDRIREQE